MSPRSLAINALFPVVWADPQTLHIGFDPPRVILRDVQDDLLLVVHQLTTGISESGLRMFAEASGVTNERLGRLLEQLAPVMAMTPPMPTGTFVLDAPHNLALRASHALTSIGVDSVLAGADEPVGNTPGEVLIFAHFVPDPEQFTRWLRRDTPHTPIIFTDQAITVGPRINPGEDACLHCELATDKVLPWSSVPIVSQLWGRRAPTATPENITRATWHATTMVEHGGPRHQLRITAWTGEQVRRDVESRSGCGCRGLS
jgi:hypothetical protein